MCTSTAIVASLLLLAALPGCVTRTASGTALAPGTQAGIEGRVVAIDTAPWAYDGNATVQVATQAHGIVMVHLPARWNLCKAPPVDVESLAVGDEVRATGSVDVDAGLVVCERAEHGLLEIE